ncbi:hypothetical protein BJY16_001981 [Actinoplanes octamycinicus]|uniref:Uncharacterized protein n=1 Tax=Actinoplanes octamycinicus TaxID=135948 RepID=A0A7W7GUK2_9ACTN|nr:hypothetical protein [Actinoplanes octamycinicus]MBB4738522.1 hypothetical protein [Actinoplanes octamycinicus]
MLLLLQCATRLRAMEIDRGVRTDVPWESILAQIITWHAEIPLGEGPCTEQAALEICRAALEAARLDNLHGTIRAGGYKVRRQGEAFRVRQCWDPAIEAADMFLEATSVPVDLPEITPVELRWIKSRLGSSRELPSSDVLQASSQRAEVAIEAYCQALPEGHLPGTFLLDQGLTISQAKKILSVVMGFASLCEAAARIYKRTEVTLVNLRRERLLETIAELRPDIEPSHTETLIERLTYRPGRSCRTSPLVEVGEAIILCPPLITPRVVDGIILRGAAYDPNRYGPIGQRQGARAVKWKDWFTGVPGVVVAERIRARRSDRTAAGDLDVVAVDVPHRRGLCLEIKWPIDATTLSEVTKTEDWVNSAALQVDRLRKELQSGTAAVQMPPGWPAFDDIDWTWAVGTPQQLCLRPSPIPNVYSTSFRYLSAHGHPEGIMDVIDTITSPDLPAEGLHFQIDTIDYEIGRWRVIQDAILLKEDGWAPRAWAGHSKLGADSR